MSQRPPRPYLLRDHLSKSVTAMQTAVVALPLTPPLSSVMQLATERFEEGEQALHKARGVESEHQARLRSIHSQMERLRQQEEQLLQVRLSLELGCHSGGVRHTGGGYYREACPPFCN